MERVTEQLQQEINKVVLGKEQIVRKVLLAILAQGHVLLEDVPGVGKTTLAKAFSKTLGLDSKRVQFTSDTLPSDIIGFSVFDKADGKLKYQSGAIMTNLLLGGYTLIEHRQVVAQFLGDDRPCHLVGLHLLFRQSFDGHFPVATGKIVHSSFQAKSHDDNA